MPLSFGDKLGPYEILAPIGAGGMGQVYRAHDSRLNRDVAIKVSAAQFSERFEREAKAIAALNHSNICQVYDVGPNYLVMELIEGTPLKGHLALDQALRYAAQICDALDAAHKKNITHRDLKPANILVTASGVKLLDFGLAKTAVASVPGGGTETMALTEAGAVMGTPAYMSPEQAKGEEVDARSDIFSFGVVLYEMLSGRRAFARNSSVETMSAILKDEPAALDAPSQVSEIVMRCLRKSSKDRFQTVSDVRKALDQANAKPAEQQPSIAVLPFANMSGDKEQEYFSDGLAEEIINALANIPGIRVIARTSAFAFKGQNVDVRKIAEALGVVNILEGSVRKAGNRIRVTAQLITAADGSHLWSQRFDRDLEDVFAIQDEISAAIAAALRVKLSLAPRKYVPRAEAHEALLKGCYHVMKATPEAMAISRRCFEQAIELDPGFALAHARLGRYFFVLASAQLLPAREMMPLARAAILRAIEIDASLPEAHAVLGGIAAALEYDWAEAGRQFELAMACETVPPEVRHMHGLFYLLPLGRSLEASREIGLAVQADPLNSMYFMHLGISLYAAGKTEEAYERLRQSLELDDRNWIAHLNHTHWLINEERIPEALRAAERTIELAPFSPAAVATMAAVLTLNGDASRSAELIQQLGSHETFAVPCALTACYLLLQDFEKAAAWAEKAIEQRDVVIPFALQLGIGRGLRSSAYWPKLAKLMNLPKTA